MDLRDSFLAEMEESERRAREPLHLFLNATEMRLFGDRFRRWPNVVVHAQRPLLVPCGDRSTPRRYTNRPTHARLCARACRRTWVAPPPSVPLKDG